MGLADWLKDDMPPRKRWQVLLSGALSTVSGRFLGGKVKDLERRVERLERAKLKPGEIVDGMPKTRFDEWLEGQARKR